jgi:hypothetical protein
MVRGELERDLSVPGLCRFGGDPGEITLLIGFPVNTARLSFL